MDGGSRGEGWAPGREQGGARGEGAREGVGVGSRGVGAGIDRGGGGRVGWYTHWLLLYIILYTRIRVEGRI